MLSDDMKNKSKEKIRKKIKKLLPKMLVEIIEDDIPSGLNVQLIGPNLNISEFLPLQDHAKEFKGNNDIKNTILELGLDNPLFRKIRGDGNCFFRVAAIQFIEKLLEDDIELDKFSIAKSRVIIFLKELLNVKIKCNLETDNPKLEIALKDVDSLKYVLKKNISEILLEKFVLEIKHTSKKVAYRKLLDFFQEKINSISGFDIALVVFLRSWILQIYRDNLEVYKNFIYDNSAEGILKTFGLEAENVIIPIVADTLECTVTINMVHTDYKTKKTILLVEKYTGLLGKKANEDINLNMYFRPGHYECLYDRMFYKKYYKDIPGFEDL